jgi:hypothetical protein
VADLLHVDGYLQGLRSWVLALAVLKYLTVCVF